MRCLTTLLAVAAAVPPPVISTTGVQVVSDIDDTIECPNPSKRDGTGFFIPWLKGVDKRIEQKEIYPGVAELMLGLALGPAYNPAVERKIVAAKVLLLSAQPESLHNIREKLGYSNDKINKHFEDVGKQNHQSDWGINTGDSMYGSFTDNLKFDSDFVLWVAESPRRFRNMGRTKAKQFIELSEARKNTRFIFFGDNGQGDVCAAQFMLERTNMVAAFIHKTQRESKAITECLPPDTKIPGQKLTPFGNVDLDLKDVQDKVHFFKTHSKATKLAFDNKFISCCSARLVWEAVEEWYNSKDGCEGKAENCDNDCKDDDCNTRKQYCCDVKKDQAILETTFSECNAKSQCQHMDGAVITTTEPDDVSAASASYRDVFISLIAMVVGRWCWS